MLLSVSFTSLIRPETVDNHSHNSGYINNSYFQISPPANVHTHRRTNGTVNTLANGKIANGHVAINIPSSSVIGQDDHEDGGDGEGGNRTLERQKVSYVRKKSSTGSKAYPREIKKTLLAFLFMVFNMFLTGASLAIVHEYLPETPPLPDQILDRINYQKWALFGCEYVIQLQTVMALLVVLLHKHRFLVLRRAFLIVGVLYMYRSITFFVTNLPKSDPEYHCAPKTNGTLNFFEVMRRSLKIVTGLGLTMNGNHVYCGDFIYSGHTMILFTGYLVIKECKKSLVNFR